VLNKMNQPTVFVTILVWSDGIELSVHHIDVLRTWKQRHILFDMRREAIKVTIVEELVEVALRSVHFLDNFTSQEFTE